MSLSGVNQNHCQENQILCHCNLSIKAVFSWSLKVYVMSQFVSNGIFPFFGHTWWYMKMSLKQRKCEKKTLVIIYAIDKYPNQYNDYW